MKKLKLLIFIACLATTLTACDTKVAYPESSSDQIAKEDALAQTDDSDEDKDTLAQTDDSDENKTDDSDKKKSDDSSDTSDAQTDETQSDDSDSDEATISTDNNTATADSGMTPFEAHGKLTLNGTKIVDANNEPFQIKGVSTHGIAWFPQYVNADAFASVRNDWNGNCMRLAMYSDEDNGYCSGGNKDNLKQLVKDGVQYATDLGMYVIIDWHVLGEQNPNVHKDEAKQFFAEMSSLYADYDNVLYEICNEPNGNVNWSSIKKYAEEVIPVIRKNDSDALIIVGTPTWSQDVDQAAKDPIKGYDNILYTIHFYADTHKEDLRRKARIAIDANLPLFCTEFGICDASGNGKCNQTEA